jgi:hypothetical protein
VLALAVVYRTESSVDLTNIECPVVLDEVEKTNSSHLPPQLFNPSQRTKKERRTW